MNKPCKEEITDLRIEINKLSFFLVIFFTAAAECQVPINGFCKFNSFPVEKGMTNLFSLNFNNDAYSDLLVFSPNKMKMDILQGNQSNTFLPYKSSSIRFEPSVIQNVLDRNKRIAGYAFSSRKKSKTGIITFSNSGLLHVKSEIKLSSYPENISASDINGNGETELLISGGAFDGLSIITIEKNKLKENKIVKGAVYSNAVFADISNDLIPDIVAFNLYDLKIDLFYNTGAGQFRRLRSIQTNKQLKSLKMFDVNLDSYQDIILSYEKNIDIYSGNFNSDFTLSKSISTYYSPDKVIASDLNKDGKIDIAYIDTAAGIFSVIFSSAKNDFYNEIIYMQRSGIKDLIPFYSKFINGAAIADENGFVYTITNLQSISGTINILPALEPSSLNYFNSDNYDPVKDICFIDKGDNKLKLFIRNGLGIPYLYLDNSLSANFDFLLTQYLGDATNFIMYSKWENLLESFKYSIKSSSRIRNYFYTDGNILDVKVSEKTKQIFVCSYDNEKLYLTILDEDLKKISVHDYFLGAGINDAKIYTGKNLKVYFWQKRGDSLNLYATSLTGNLERPIPIQTLPRDDEKNYVRDYFVNRTNFRNYHLVYKNKENKCISLKQVP